MSPKPTNVVYIRPRPLFFGMDPVFPEVKAKHEPLQFVVDWSGNAKCWNQVVVRSLCDLDGRPRAVSPPAISVKLGDDAPHTMSFHDAVDKRTPCKFVVELHRADPRETFVVDPGVILSPGP